MKQRLDQLLVERGLADSVSLAQSLIMAGQVKADGRVVSQSGQLVARDADIEVVGLSPYVSRGGEKLASVAPAIGIEFEDKNVLDVGASTGGFTDYALKSGARSVVTVDVGTGQLDWRLRNDPRVQVHERTDIRDFQLGGPIDLVLVDVSFVSILKILPTLKDLGGKKALIAALVKPQFEAPKPLADRFHGVISDEAIREKILSEVRAKIKVDFNIIKEADSKLMGAKGNRERFFLLRSKR